MEADGVIRKDLRRSAWLSRNACLLSLLLTCFAGAEPPSQTIDAAEDFMNHGQYARAVEAWATLARQHPEQSIIHAQFGLTLAHLARYPEAADQYRLALRSNPNQPLVQFSLGLAEFQQGHFAAATTALLASTTSHTPDERTATLLGMAYYGQGLFQAAIPYLDQVAQQQQPSNPQLSFVLAESCLQAAQTNCALREARHVLEADPNSPEAHMLLGETLDGLSRTRDAVAEFSAAAEANTSQPNVHFGLGYLFWKLHDYDHAQAEFHAELQHFPDNASSFAYLGDIAFRTEDPQAEVILQHARALDSHNRLTRFDLGCVLSQKQQPAAAIAEFQAAQQLDPTQPDTYYRLGRLYLAQGKKQQADHEFAQSKALHQKQDELLIHRISGATPPQLP